MNIRKKMHILITGGAGFIGSHLAELHLNRGDEVLVVDNLSTGSKENIMPFLTNKLFTFVEHDLLTWPDLHKNVAKADRIYHLAALVGMYHLLAHPLDTLHTNIFGCHHLLNAIVHTGSQARFIFASTSEIYGPSSNTLLNENDLLLFKSAIESKWVYATSKFTDEMFTLAYVKSKGVQATIVRLFNTIGPRQNGRYGMVVPRFIDQALRAIPITVYGDGHQVRSFCNVADTVIALDRIADSPKTIGEIINFGQDEPISMNELAKLVKRLTTSPSQIKHISYEEAYGQYYEDILYRRPDLTKFNNLIEFKYQWHLEKSLQDLIAKGNCSPCTSS
jgi:UDP-glucose 4-epimerase